MTEPLWWLTLAAIAVAACLDAIAGETAALVAALVATVLTIATALVDRPAEPERRPWPSIVDGPYVRRARRRRPRSSS